MLIPLLTIGLILGLIWSGYLTYQLKKTTQHYNNLVAGSDKKTVEAILGNLLKDTNQTKKDIAHLNNRCDILEKNELYHIQKIGLLRFNPFNDTGGDQSFILTLSD